MTILIFILILGILVFVHELGHFMVARWSGVDVEEFGFGFPPRIIGIRRGSTTYSINWIPFGGFVRLKGEQGNETNISKSFLQAPFHKQFLIMAAGVTMNALLAWFILTVTLVFGVSSDPTRIPNNSNVRLSASRVEAIVTDKSPAALSGLMTGDVVVGINGQALQTTEQVVALVQANSYPTLEIEVLRKKTSLMLSVTPRQASEPPRYGLGIQQIVTIKYPWYIAPWYGLLSVIDLTKQTLMGFGKLIYDLITTAQVSPDVTGPVGIAVLTGQIAQYGFIATLQFMAILSISLAVINFLPLPALDGGRVVFAIITRVRGRPVDQKIENMIHAIGFYILLLLILLLSIRDITKFRLVDQFKGLFQ